jgi:hypothetical protein
VLQLKYEALMREKAGTELKVGSEP